MLNCNDFPYDRHSLKIQYNDDTLSIYSMFTFMLGLISSFYMQEIAHHAWFFNPINLSHLSCLSHTHTYTSMNDMWTDVIYIQFWSFFFILIFSKETNKKKYLNTCVYDKLFYVRQIFTLKRSKIFAYWSLRWFELWFPSVRQETITPLRNKVIIEIIDVEIDLFT